jgi:hypothetical protein
MKIELKDLRLLFINLIYAYQIMQVENDDKEIDAIIEEIIRICYIAVDEIDTGEIDEIKVKIMIDEIERLRYQITIK